VPFTHRLVHRFHELPKTNFSIPQFSPAHLFHMGKGATISEAANRNVVFDMDEILLNGLHRLDNHIARDF